MAERATKGQVYQEQSGWHLQWCAERGIWKHVWLTAMSRDEAIAQAARFLIVDEAHIQVLD